MSVRLRPAREVTDDECNARIVPFVGTNMVTIKRDPVEPEPAGTVVMMAFRITGYDRDCDGSLMARFEHIDKNGDGTGWAPTNLGLYPDTDLVVEGDLRQLWEAATWKR